MSVEISTDQLSSIRQAIQLSNRLEHALTALDPEARPGYQARVGDLFAQAVSWCKLDLRLQSGLTQDNQRIQATELVSDLDQAVITRVEYVVAYISTELDLS